MEKSRKGMVRKKGEVVSPEEEPWGRGTFAPVAAFKKSTEIIRESNGWDGKRSEEEDGRGLAAFMAAELAELAEAGAAEEPPRAESTEVSIAPRSLRLGRVALSLPLGREGN